MSTLLYGFNRRAIPEDEAVVRSTVTVVQADAPSSELSSTPDFNETVTDDTTEGGLTPRQMGPHMTAIQRAVPHHAGRANTDYSVRVDSQVSSSGTAAAREESGQWGHGSMQISEMIEPVIRDGAAFDDLYFTANERPLAHAGATLEESAPTDEITAALAHAQGVKNSRQAAQGLYAALHAARMGA